MRKTHPAPARAPYTPRTTDLRFASLCDEEVAARALSGDAAAFGVLMARHGSKVYRRALRILANPCDAEMRAPVIHDVAGGPPGGPPDTLAWLYLP